MGRRNLVGYGLWGCKESDTTEATEHTCTHTHITESLFCTPETNTTLQITLQFKYKKSQGFPGCPVVKTELPLQRMQVWSLAGELYPPCWCLRNMAKKENTNTHPYPPEKDFTSADKEVLLGQSIYYLCLINSCLQEEHWRDSDWMCLKMGGRICPFLPRCPFYWHIIVDSTLLWSFVFLCCLLWSLHFHF